MLTFGKKQWKIYVKCSTQTCKLIRLLWIYLISWIPIFMVRGKIVFSVYFQLHICGHTVFICLLNVWYISHYILICLEVWIVTLKTVESDVKHYKPNSKSKPWIVTK